MLRASLQGGTASERVRWWSPASIIICLGWGWGKLTSQVIPLYRRRAPARRAAACQSAQTASRPAAGTALRRRALRSATRSATRSWAVGRAARRGCGSGLRCGGWLLPPDLLLTAPEIALQAAHWVWIAWAGGSRAVQAQGPVRDLSLTARSCAAGEVQEHSCTSLLAGGRRAERGGA